MLKNLRVIPRQKCYFAFFVMRLLFFTQQTLNPQHSKSDLKVIPISASGTSKNTDFNVKSKLLGTVVFKTV